MIRSVIAGLLLAAAAAPHDRWYLAVVGLAILFSAVRNESRRRTVLRTFIAYGVMFAFTLSWTQQFTLPGRVALSIAEAAILAIPLVALPKTRQAHGAIAFVGLTTLAEFIRTYVPWGGLPFGNITTGLIDAPYAGAASIVGEIGLLSLTALIAVAIVGATRFPKTVGLPAIVLILAVSLAGAWDYTTPQRTLPVATVQAGGPQGLERAEQRPDRVFQGHLATTGRVKDAQFIAWPENVVTVNGPVEATSEGAGMSSLARSRNAFVGAGVVERNRPEGTFRNAYVVWSPEGEIISRYEKRRRVPFGEYVPFRSVFDRIADLSQVPYDAVPGKGSAAIDTGQAPAAVAISYEGMFSRLVGSGVADGGQFVLIPTNAASYENPAVAETQVRGARLRALETGRSVVQAAPTGISVIIASDSRILEISQVGEAEVLETQIELRSGTTPYVRWGNAPLLLIATLVIALALRHERRRRQAKKPESGR